MAADIQLGIIRTQIPARLDRLPWSRFHWHIVAGLGTVWILDGLEVTIVGSIGARLTEPGSGIDMTTAGIGIAAAIYVAGACGGSLVFGQLTDRYGRKKLMMLTLSLYIVATVLTAFAFAPWYFFLSRFFTGAGIGGEYAAINSAIDELIPARNRGQVDISINGSYWVGSAIGGVAALFFLDTAIFPTNIGWRIAFAVGAVLGCGILLVRRSVPESPRWLFIHGRDAEAERIVDGIEAEVRSETHQELAPPGKSITVRQRRAIPFREIAKVAIKFYPKRAVLGFALFVGQAFLYNAVTFNLGTMLSGFFGVSSGFVPVFMVIFAVGNFLGPFLLGRLFDTVGRVPMISGTYLGSAALTVVLAVLLIWGNLGAWSFIAMVGLTFFLASSGASAAYLTVSEIFPMETRALAIAFFYALGTGVGGIVGPLLFGNLISGGRGAVAIGFFVGAAVMALGGLAELAFGVHAEGAELEDIAKPLTVADAERETTAPASTAPAQRPELLPEQQAAAQYRERAEEERARAAEHRAAAHQLRSAGDGDRRAADQLRAEATLARISDLRAQGLEEEAAGHEQLAQASPGQSAERTAAQERADAAHQRATVLAEQAEALAARDRSDAESHNALAEAAKERAAAHEQRAQAALAGAADGDRRVVEARAGVHDAWAEAHLARAQAHEARAEGRRQYADRAAADAERKEELALSAQDRAEAAGHWSAAHAAEQQVATLEEQERARTEAAERERMARQRDERISRRIQQREARERSGLRRFRPGPGDHLYSPGMFGTASRWAPTAEQDLDREIETIGRALEDRGPLDRDELADLVGARYWGPGRFGSALQAAVDEGRAEHLSRGRYGPARTVARTG
jgi:MFS family permease